jgi:hypothetical protein
VYCTFALPGQSGVEVCFLATSHDNCHILRSDQDDDQGRDEQVGKIGSIYSTVLLDDV